VKETPTDGAGTPPASTSMGFVARVELPDPDPELGGTA
jgi:hypothetical protein